MSSIYLNLKLTFLNPRKFNQIDDYRLFVFEKHMELREQFIHIKLPNGYYAEFKELVSPFTQDNSSAIYPIDCLDDGDETVVYPLN